MNVKIEKTEAILLILIVMINKILLNIPKEIIRQSQTGTPINLIYTTILAILITLLICKLFKKFPNEDIIEISEYIGKKPLKILVGSLFILLFTIIIITVIYEFSNLLQLIYFPNTPEYLMFIIFLSCMGVANKIGFKAIVKTNGVIIPIILLSLIIIFFGTFEDLNFTRLNPILGTNIKNTFLKGSLNIFGYGGLLYLFFILPFLKNKNEFKKIALTSIIISGLFLIFTTIILLSIFPFIINSEEIMSMYLLTRSIELGKFLQRTDAIFIFLWIISSFSYLSISLMFINNIFAKLTNCTKSHNYSFSFLSLFFALLVLFQNQSLFKYLETTFYKYFVLALLVLCLIILIIGYFKRKEPL